MSERTKKVSVFYDAQSGVDEGWVARCTEYEGGKPVLGRIDMDEPVGDEDTPAEVAQKLAAAHWEVAVEDVRIEKKYAE